MTLSPLTEMATRFHSNNGAKLIQINETTQNFEYQVLKRNNKTLGGGDQSPSVTSI